MNYYVESYRKNIYFFLWIGKAKLALLPPPLLCWCTNHKQAIFDEWVGGEAHVGF